MEKAAFFDIDGTLFRNSLLIEHFLLLTADGVIEEDAWRNEIGPSVSYTHLTLPTT